MIKINFWIGTLNEAEINVKKVMAKMDNFKSDFKKKQHKNSVSTDPSDDNFFNFVTQTVNHKNDHSIDKSVYNEPSVPNSTRVSRLGLSRRPSNRPSNNRDSNSPHRVKKLHNLDEYLFAYWEKENETEKLKLDEFSLITFQHSIPSLIIDLIEYCTGMNLNRRFSKAKAFKLMKGISLPSFEYLDGELINYKKLIGKENYATLVNGFMKFCANPEAIMDNQWFITKQSIHSNFSKVFTYNKNEPIYSEYFANNLFYYLTSGSEMSKIPLATFIKQMHMFIGIFWTLLNSKIIEDDSESGTSTQPSKRLSIMQKVSSEKFVVLASL